MPARPVAPLPHRCTGWWRSIHRLGLFALTLLAVTASPAFAGTTTVNFDPPTYSEGQIISGVPGAATRGRVYRAPMPGIPGYTSSPPFALRSEHDKCLESRCSNGANRVWLDFPRGISEVSMKVGAANNGWEFCFPEIHCDVWARLTGYDANANLIVDSRDVNVTVRPDGFGDPGSVATRMAVSDPSGRIRSVMLRLGVDLFDRLHEGNPSPWAIDDLSFTSPDEPIVLPPDPDPPAVRITGPTDGAYISHPYGDALRGTFSAPSGLLGFCFRLDDPSRPSAANCNQTSVIGPGGTFSLSFADLAPSPGTHRAYVWVLDLAGRAASASMAFKAMDPPGPTLEISNPAAGARLNADTPVKVHARVQALGRLRGYCITTNVAAIPPASACTDQTWTAAGTTYSISAEIPVAQLRRGDNELRVTAYDQQGYLATRVVSFKRPTNLRIVGLELTQGTQTAAGFIQPFHTGMGLVGLIPSAGAFVANQAYTGTNLTLGGKTILRVFVNHDGTGALPASAASVLVTGMVERRDGSLKPIGWGVPEFTPSDIPRGPDGLVTAVRSDPTAAYTFSLPRDWDDDIAAAGLRLFLRASVSPEFPNAECSGCANDNAVSVVNVPFKVVAVPPPVTPVEVVFRDSSGVLQRPPAPTAVFSDVDHVAPLPARGQPVTPYIGTVDVTDVVNALRGGLDSFVAQMIVFTRVASFAGGFDSTPRFVYGVIAKGAGIRGIALPWVVCCALTPAPTPRVENIAIAEANRPLRDVVHEWMHGNGYLHAGERCPSVALAINWPPDNRGLLQGFGLDRRPSMKAGNAYRIITPTPSSEFFDLMSYCGALVDDRDAWISPRNWNAFGSRFPNGVIPGTLFSAPTASAAATPRVATPAARKARNVVTVLGIVGATRRENELHVTRATGAGYAYGARRSPYTLVAYGRGGNVVARVPMVVSAGAPEESGSGGREILQAALGAGDRIARLEVLRNGRTLLSQRVDGSAPRVRLLSPRSGTGVRANGTLTVRWSEHDADRDALTARLEYATDGRRFRVIANGLRGGRATIPTRLLSKSRRARLRLVVSDGQHETAVVSGRLRTAGAAGSLRITQPAAGDVLIPDRPITLTAERLAVTGRRLAGAGLVWSLDGRRIAKGANATIPAPKPGRHRLKVTGAGSSAQSTITITQP